MPAAMTLEAVNDQMAVMISLTMVSSCTRQKLAIASTRLAYVTW